MVYKISLLLEFHVRVGQKKILLDICKTEVKQWPLLSEEYQNNIPLWQMRKCWVHSSLFLLFFALNLISFLSAILLTNGGDQ